MKRIPDLIWGALLLLGALGWYLGIMDAVDRRQVQAETPCKVLAPAPIPARLIGAK